MACPSTHDLDHDDRAAKLAYAPAEAARKLSIGRSTLYELMASGQVASFKVGGSRRISHRALATFLAKCENEVT